MWWKKTRESAKPIAPPPSPVPGPHPDLTRQREEAQRMAPRGRGIIVLSGVAILGLAGVGMSVYLQQQEHQARLAAEQQAASTRAQNQQLQQEVSQAHEIAKQLEENVSRSNEQLRQLTDELTKQQDSNRMLSQSVDERQQELSRLSQEFEKVSAERNTLTAELAQLKDEQQRLRAQLGELETAKRDLETKVTELSTHPTVELDKVVVTPESAAPAASAPSMPSAPGGMQGQVVVVNREYDFIVMNLGRNQGLQIGQEFQISRGEEVLGRVKVEKVYDELSAAAILPDSKKDSIREGDQVKAI